MSFDFRVRKLRTHTEQTGGWTDRQTDGQTDGRAKHLIRLIRTATQ